jgi:hypothetical protein
MYSGLLTTNLFSVAHCEVAAITGGKITGYSRLAAFFVRSFTQP